MARIGVYAKYREVRLQTVQRLVFVCRGNICRSPYAEAYARSLGIESASCGLSALNDRVADAKAVAAASRRGTPIGSHQTRRFDSERMVNTDLLVAMEPVHIRELMRDHAAHNERLTLLGIWTQPAQPYVFDPFGMSDEAFDRCFAIIEMSVDGLAAALKDAGANVGLR